MFVTSTVEMDFPGLDELIKMFLDQLLYYLELISGEMMIFRKLDLRFKPEFCFAVTGHDMDMLPCLFARKEEKPVK